MEERSYTIEERVFIQRPLVWGQVRQLLEVVKGVALREGDSTMDVVVALGDKMPHALAVVLTEKGQSIKDKDMTALAEFLGFSIPVEMMVTVIEDFFECNPTASYLEKVQKLIGKIGEPMMDQINSSIMQSSSSAAETSVNET